MGDTCMKAVLMHNCPDFTTTPLCYGPTTSLLTGTGFGGPSSLAPLKASSHAGPFPVYYTVSKMSLKVPMLKKTTPVQSLPILVAG